MGAMKNGRDYCKVARRYAEQVVSGKIPACQWVKRACQRQIDDLKRKDGDPGPDGKPKDWPWKFDRGRAEKICRVAELTPHIKGRWTSRLIVLEPWQCFILTTIFGWVDGNGLRRFRKALVVIPRKNSKTTLGAVVGNYLLAIDGEPGAEVYAVAVTKDQVTGPSGVWTTAKLQVERCPGLREEYGVEPMAHSIVVESTASSFKPLARDADSLEGLNVHGAIIDELHAHKTREVYDVINEATGSRTQPLIFIISTEGDNAAGVFAEQVSYGQQILTGNHEDDSYFCIYYGLDPEDDWTLPTSWEKANPNYNVKSEHGVKVLAEDLASRCREALKNPASQGSFLCKRLNVRVGAKEGAVNMFAWRTVCKDETLKIENFYGERCFIALDLASTSDIAAKCYLFRRTGTLYFFGRYYLPAEAGERGNPNYDLYRGWEKLGNLILTDTGPKIDYDYIELELIEDVRHKFAVERVCLDPANSWQFNARMQKELGPDKVQDVPQSWPKMSHPMKELIGLITAGKVKHDGDPVMDWMVGNVMGKTDAKEMVFPFKSRPENKIDFWVAALMALGTEMSLQPASSAYDSVPIAI